MAKNINILITFHVYWYLLYVMGYCSLFTIVLMFLQEFNLYTVGHSGKKNTLPDSGDEGLPCHAGAHEKAPGWSGGRKQESGKL